MARITDLLTYFCGLILWCAAVWGSGMAPAYSQSHVNSSQTAITLLIDNDSFTIPQIDDYYTSGIQLGLRRTLSDSSVVAQWLRTPNRDLRRAVFELGIGHRFFTPNSYEDANPIEFDRPYAGWVFMDGALDVFYGRRQWIHMGADLGIVGPAAQAGEIQTFWHRILDYDLPQGWDYQINNTPAVNLQFGHALAVVDHHYVQLMSRVKVEAGTIRNYARAGGTFRFGELNHFSRSVFTGSNLMASDQQEVYGIIGYQYEYVFYNSLIEGNFIGKASPHTEVAVPWVSHEKYGFGFAGNDADFSMVLNRLSREVVGGERHRYLTMKLIVRF